MTETRLYEVRKAKLRFTTPEGESLEAKSGMVIDGAHWPKGRGDQLVRMRMLMPANAGAVATPIHVIKGEPAPVSAPSLDDDLDARIARAARPVV